jgi:hypothetical protein
MLVPLFEVLDVCDSSRSCDRRLVTTVAPQALSLFNGDHVKRQMRHLAARLRHDVGPDHVRQIQHAFRLALCRQPTATEIEALRSRAPRPRADLPRDLQPERVRVCRLSSTTATHQHG